jgi:mRNA-degrading endonuclease RelE of RelBE toxin-antitoxin system
MRSGTSMMCEALSAGGLEVVYSKRREAFCQKLGKGGYKPNEQFFEIEASELYSSAFPEMYEGKLIKVLWHSLIRIPCYEYRVIFMRRPKEEIAASCKATFGSAPREFLNDFEFLMESTIDLVRDRHSVVSLDEVWYSDVLDDPVGVFARIGWPINPEKAAAVPTRDKYRHRAGEPGCGIRPKMS